MSMSLASRITVRLTITTLIAAAVAYGWLYVKQSRVASYLRERSLTLQAQEIAGFVSVGADGSIYLNLPSKLSEAYNNPGSFYRYAVHDQSGRIVAASGRRVGPVPEFIERQDRNLYSYRAEPGNNSIIGAAIRTEIGKRIFVTQVEQTLPMTRSLNAAVFNEFSMDGGWLGIPFLIGLLAVSAFTVRRTLAPLNRLAGLASQIDPGNSTLRLPEAGIPAETLPLVTSVNNCLDRLDEGLRRQREFNANAAHQLRTPLAVLAANIDSMADKDAAAKLRYDVEIMTRIVQQLLLVARLETLSLRLDEPVDLCQAARQTAENLGPLAISGRKTLEVEEPADPVFVHGNGFVVSVAISNLIENALNHSPEGRAVRIRVTATPSVEIEDCGPGIPVALRERVFERFWRGDTNKDGAGLGLAIVRRIMNAIHGTVSVADSPDGGAQFTLQFDAWRQAEALPNP